MGNRYARRQQWQFARETSKCAGDWFDVSDAGQGGREQEDAWKSGGQGQQEAWNRWGYSWAALNGWFN